MPPLRFAALALIVGLAPGIAVAQINPFRGRGADRLTNADMQMLMSASDRLLARPSLRTGTSESWKNDQTGASGSVAVKGTSHRHGLLCHALGYRARSGAGLSPRDNTLTWCKTPDGEWKIAS